MLRLAAVRTWNLGIRRCSPRWCHTHAPISEAEFDRCMRESLFAAAHSLSAPIIRKDESRGTHGLLLSIEKSILAKISGSKDPLARERQDGRQKPVIALAYSGGSDSLALALLTHQWLSKSGDAGNSSLLAIHVDHNLRPEASAEAKQGLSILEKFGIETKLQTLNFGPGSTAMQDKLRKERYRCLQSECVNARIHMLLTGHHLDDEVETIVMRQQRSSTLFGISGTPTASKLSPSLSVLRPLLSFPKGRLQATCKKFGIDWIEDASNNSHKYTRNIVRDGIRSVVNSLEDTPVSVGSFHRLAETLRDIGSDLQSRVTSMIDRYVTICWTQGYATLDVGAMMADAQTSPFQHHLLRAIASVCSKDQATGGKQFVELSGALKRILAYGPGRWRLPHAGGLAWTLVVTEGQPTLLIAHAAVAKRATVPLTIRLGEWTQWDRWQVRATVASEAEEGFDITSGVRVQAIDDSMWRTLLSIDNGAFKDHLRNLPMPFEAKRSVPVFIDGKSQVLSVPQLGLYRTTSVRTESIFRP